MDGFVDKERDYGFARYCLACGDRAGGFREDDKATADGMAQLHKCHSISLSEFRFKLIIGMLLIDPKLSEMVKAYLK